MKRLRLIGALACAAALLAAVPALAPASVQVGSSGWQWGNPLPQGNTLRSISFAGPNGYAAGDFGTLLRTADGGATWSGLLSGTFTNLTDVQAIDGDAVFAAGGCVARRSDDGGATFTRVAFTPVESSCKEQFAAGWFVSRQTGFIVLADGTVLRTDNNGDTFAQKNPLPGTRAPGGAATPVDVRFLTDQIGVGATSDGKIYRTTDGANTWTVVNDTNRAVHSFVFLDASNGFAVGDGSLFLVTKDGGATWTPKDIGIPPTNLRSIQCATREALRDHDRAGHGARAHRRRRRHGQARHALPGPDLRRGLRLSDAHRRGRRDGRHGGLRRRGAELHPDRRPPERELHARARRRPDRDGLRARRQRLAGQDDRRRQDVDARQCRDLRGRHRRRLPDRAGGLRARLVGRPVPHQRRRRDLEDARHRHDRAAVPARRPDARRPSSWPAPPACAAPPTAATPSRPSRTRTW